jgi:hypothetical protein
MDSQQRVEILLYGTGPKELLVRWKAFREERNADPKAWEERGTAVRKGRITVRPEEMSADTKARLEEIAATTDKIMAARREMRNTSHKEIVAENKPKIDMKTTACQEMEAHQEESKPTSLDRKPEAEQEEVHVEDAELMPVGEPKTKRRRDRKLAAERRRQKTKNQHGKVVDHRRDWPSPAEGQHAVRKWHGKRQEAGRCPVVQQ